MNAISLWEPWASLIMCGAKTIETRSWYTKYRGPLLVCAAKGGLPIYELINLLSQTAFLKGLAPLVGLPLNLKGDIPVPYPKIVDLNHGKALTVVNLVDCKKTDDLMQREFVDDKPFGDFSCGRYAWILKDNRPVKPFRVKGHQGFFQVPDELIHYR